MHAQGSFNELDRGDPTSRRKAGIHREHSIAEGALAQLRWHRMEIFRET